MCCFSKIAKSAKSLHPTVLFLILVIAYGLHLARQARDVRADDPTGALRLFRSNRDAGLILFAAIALGAWNG